MIENHLFPIPLYADAACSPASFLFPRSQYNEEWDSDPDIATQKSMAALGQRTYLGQNLTSEHVFGSESDVISPCEH
jgi:hypothetical protein